MAAACQVPLSPICGVESWECVSLVLLYFSCVRQSFVSGAVVGGGEQEARKEWRNLLQGRSLSGKHLTALVNSACARAWLSAGLRPGAGLGCAARPSPVFHSCAPIFDKLASNRIAAQLSSNLMASGQPEDLLEHPGSPPPRP